MKRFPIVQPYVESKEQLISKEEDSMATTSISDLPGEIIQQILLYCPPITLAAVQRLSRRYNALVEPFLWRHQCRTQYRYWDPEHHIKEKLRGNINDVDWQNVFSERQRIDRITSSALEGILANQMGRIDKFQRIVECGYDAKDCLLQHMAIDDDGEDVLARRYMLYVACAMSANTGAGTTVTQYWAVCTAQGQSKNGHGFRIKKIFHWKELWGRTICLFYMIEKATSMRYYIFVLVTAIVLIEYRFPPASTPLQMPFEPSIPI